MNKDEKFDWTKYAAIFVSVIAVLTSIYLGNKAQKHSQIMVSPLLDLTYGYTDIGGNFNYGVRVDNPGAGPAIINSYHIFWHGEDGQKSELENWEALSEKLNIDNTSERIGVVTFKNGNALKAGREKLLIYGVRFRTDESLALEKAIEDGILDVTIKYSSLAGETKSVNLQGM